MDSADYNAYRNGLLCLFLCIALGIWFFIRIIKNRRKLNRNMELMGNELKRIEERIRKSAGELNEDEANVLEEYANNSEIGFMDLMNLLKRREEEEIKRKLEKQEEFNSDGEVEGDLVPDKKNV